jgi:hypothetical protein
MGPRRVTTAVMLTVGLAWLGGSAVLAAEPSPSPSPSTSMCDQLPADDEGSFAARVGCAIGEQARQSVSAAAGQVGQAAAGGAEAAFTSWLAGGAAWVVEGVSQQALGSSTTPSLDPTRAAAVGQVYGRVVGVALSISVLLVLVGIIEATLMQQPGALRRVVTGIAVSGIGLGAVPAGTAILVRIVDDLSAYVTGGQSQVAGQGLAKVILLLQQATVPEAGPGAAFALAALGVMLAGALLWLELAIRGSLIYLFLGVVPLACAAVQWPRLEGVLRQVLFAGLALILSKLVIAISLAVGFAVLASGTGLEALLGGMFILLVAALMPFATARVLPIAAEEMTLSHQGRIRGWTVAGVGTTARLAAVVAGGPASTAASGVGLAQPAGSSGARQRDAGSSLHLPSDRGGGSGGDASPRSRTSKAGGPASRRAEASKGPGSPSAGSPSQVPPSSAAPGRDRPSLRRPRGSEPPRDGGPSPSE